MTTLGITLDTPSVNEASVATFARAGASYIRFIAKGIAPSLYLSLADAFLNCAQAIRPDFEIMIDLPGKRPRLGSTLDEVTVFEGMTVLLVDEVSRPETYRSNLVVPTVNLMTFKSRVGAGDRLLISDGATELKVLDVLPVGLLAEATRPQALLSPNRSILLPDSDIAYQPLSESDMAMIQALSESAISGSRLALSMVESAEAISQVRRLLPNARLVAKIETRRGVLNRTEIVSSADTIMLARGDLSLSLGINALPAAADLVANECMAQGRELILATGLVDGVELQGRPTIADVTDLWYFWNRGIRNYLVSGGRASKHGRQSLQALTAALTDFRFATEDFMSSASSDDVER
jgi:pyruvate kinase